MRAHYKRLGNYIEQVNVRNTDLLDVPLVGVTINKQFIPSVANTIGTNMANYKIIKKNQFACSLMQVSRDGKMPIGRFSDEIAIMSPAYPIFEVTNTDALLPEYLMMWFEREEFDREAAYYAVGGVRGNLIWEDFCDFKIPIPPIEKQEQIVARYQAVENKIKVNEQIIQKLEETAQAIFEELIGKSYKTQYRLGDLIEIKGGYSYKANKLNLGKTYLLGMGCVSYSDRFIENGMRLYSDEVPKQHLVYPKDIIIATRQQSENFPILGCPAMIPPYLKNTNMVAASNLYKVINNSNFDNEIIYQILKSRNYEEHIKLNAKGTTVGMITKDAIEDYTFSAPENTHIINIQNKFVKLSDLVFLIREVNQKLTELKSLLLVGMVREN